MGVRQGVLTHVGDAARGLECNCTCPFCGCVLVAKRGSERVPHFAHYEATPCKWGPETAIHLLAKEIIERNTALVLPKILSLYSGKVLRPEGRVNYTNVRVEQRYHDIIPDIIVSAEKHDLVIEVFVTNKVRSEKTKKIQAHKIAAIEIDVRNLRYAMNRHAIEQAIIEGVDRKRWIYSPKAAQEQLPPPRPSRTTFLGEGMSGPRAPAKPPQIIDAKPTVKAAWPNRLSEEKLAIIHGEAPARCRRCGQMTRRWKILDCDSGECVCEHC